MFRASLLIFGLIIISFKVCNASNVGIIGGKDADIKDFPYQVSFLIDDKHSCGAALIGDKWAVTSAQCTLAVEPSYCSVRVGSSKWHQGGQVVKVKTITENHNFNPNIEDFDFSIIEFETSVNFSESVKPIPLFEAGKKPEEGANATVSGWGQSRADNKTLSPNLQMIVVPIANHCECALNYADHQILITRRMICAGSTNMKDVGPCFGDGGSPLVVDEKLAGVNSNYFRCGNAELPATYADVGSFRDFIKEVTGI